MEEHLQTEHYHHELLIDYIDGLLSIEQSTAIKNHLLDCERCAAITLGIQHYNESEHDESIEEWLNNLETKLETQVKNRKKTKIKSKVISMLSLKNIAAVVLFILIPIFSDIFYFDTPSFMLKKQVAEVYENPVILKGSENVLRQEAADFYRTKDYTSASEKWEEISQTNDVKPDDFFYLGLSYFYAKNYAEAIPNFLKTTRMESSKVDAANWYLSLSYLKNKEKEKAQPILQEIIKNKNHFKKNEAQKLIKLFD